MNLFETSCDGLTVLWRWRGNEARVVGVRVRARK